MPLAECVSSHTHRQYLTWMAWLEEQWNAPSRSDYYLMQIAFMIGRVISMFSSRPTSVQFKTYLMKFNTPSAPRRKPSMEQAAAMAKAAFFGMFGRKAARLHEIAQRDADARKRQQENENGGS